MRLSTDEKVHEDFLIDNQMKEFYTMTFHQLQQFTWTHKQDQT